MNSFRIIISHFGPPLDQKIWWYTYCPVHRGLVAHLVHPFRTYYLAPPIYFPSTIFLFKKKRNLTSTKQLNNSISSTRAPHPILIIISSLPSVYRTSLLIVWYISLVRAHDTDRRSYLVVRLCDPQFSLISNIYLSKILFISGNDIWTFNFN